MEAQKQRQSRIGKRSVPVPKEVQISLAGTRVAVKGPRGELKYECHPGVEITHKDGLLVVLARPGSGPEGVRHQGLWRALLRNAVDGVHKGYQRSLDLYGVGYRAELKGQELTFGLGYSHPIKLTLPDAVKGRVEIIDEAGTKRPRLHLESVNKDLLGQTSARIREFRAPEPYKGKGVRYTGEKIRQKAGKAGKAAGGAAGGK